MCRNFEDINIDNEKEYPKRNSCCVGCNDYKEVRYLELISCCVGCNDNK